MGLTVVKREEDPKETIISTTNLESPHLSMINQEPCGKIAGYTLQS